MLLCNLWFQGGGIESDENRPMVKRKKYLEEETRKPKRRYQYHHFFIQGKLYKHIRTNKPANITEAWSYDENKLVTMIYVDYFRGYEKAVKTGEAADIINLSRFTLHNICQNGVIKEPYKILKVQAQDRGAIADVYHRWWGLEDLLRVHDAMMERNRGRPKPKLPDGSYPPVTPHPTMATRAEITARMKDQIVLYTKSGDEYVPTFAPPTF